MKKDKRPLILGGSVEKAGIGGVSIHVQRLRQWLDKLNFDYCWCDYKATSIKKQLTEIAKHEVVHIHISRPLPRLIYIIYCRTVGTKSVFTVHGNLGRFSWAKNLMDNWAVRLCNIPILINKKSYLKAMKLNKSSVLMSAFIPPVEDGYLPEYVIDKINHAKQKGKIIIASNASALAYSDSGEEIYGIDFMIKFFSEDKKYFLCISDPSGNYAIKYSDETFDNILFISEPHSFYKLMKISDIMLRPTATDGDSLSVKEALYLNKTVIATDRVDRPEGVTLFKFNDSESLSKALNIENKTATVFQQENIVPNLIKIYKHVTNQL